MRIISGKFKGRRFKTNPKVTARPTTDFAKEGLFNLLNNQIDFEGLKVLDLFAGIGSISFEFISRDAEEVVAIELNQNNLAYIRKVANELKVSNIIPTKVDVFKYVASCHQQFDLIFADPPYDLEDIATIPNLIFEHNILKEGGLFILEHSKNTILDEHPHFSHTRKYGNVHFSFFENAK